MKTRAQNIVLSILLVIWFTVVLVAVVISVKWEDSVKNRANKDFVVEVAFNLDISPSEVSQKQFNLRYKVK